MQNFNLLMGSRQLEILDLSQSSSWNAREYMLVYAQQQINQSPILGVYGGHLYFGEGAYAHNALSAWVSLGFPGFVLYMLACIASAVVSVLALLRYPYSLWVKLSSLVCMSNLLLVVVSKPIFWEMPAFGWGLAVIVGAYSRDARSMSPVKTLHNVDRSMRSSN
jgi:hypothetical protein